MLAVNDSTAIVKVTKALKREISTQAPAYVCRLFRMTMILKACRERVQKSKTYLCETLPGATATHL